MVILSFKNPLFLWCVKTNVWPFFFFQHYFIFSVQILNALKSCILVHVTLQKYTIYEQYYYILMCYLFWLVLKLCTWINIIYCFISVLPAQYASLCNLIVYTMYIMYTKQLCGSQAVDALFILCTFKGTTYLFHPADSAWCELPSVYGNLYSQSGADKEGLMLKQTVFATSAAYDYFLRTKV